MLGIYRKHEGIRETCLADSHNRCFIDEAVDHWGIFDFLHVSIMPMTCLQAALQPLAKLSYGHKKVWKGMFVHYLHPQSLLHGLFSSLFLVPRSLFKSSSVCRGASFSWTRCSKQSQGLFQQRVNSHQLPCRSFLCVSCKPMVNVT